MKIHTWLSLSIILIPLAACSGIPFISPTPTNTPIPSPTPIECPERLLWDQASYSLSVLDDKPYLVIDFTEELPSFWQGISINGWYDGNQAGPIVSWDVTEDMQGMSCSAMEQENQIRCELAPIWVFRTASQIGNIDHWDILVDQLPDYTDSQGEQCQSWEKSGISIQYQVSAEMLQLFQPIHLNIRNISAPETCNIYVVPEGSKNLGENWFEDIGCLGSKSELISLDIVPGSYYLRAENPDHVMVFERWVKDVDDHVLWELRTVILKQVLWYTNFEHDYPWFNDSWGLLSGEETVSADQEDEELSPMAVEDGQLLIQPLPDGEAQYVVLQDVSFQPPYDNILYSAEMSATDPKAELGLLCGIQNDQWIQFSINEGNQWMVKNYDVQAGYQTLGSGELTDISGPTYQLVMHCDTSEINVEVNGVPIATLPTEDYSGGGIGFMVASNKPDAISVDNMEVKWMGY